MDTRLMECGRTLPSGALVYGYLRMAEPDETEIARLRLSLGTYCKEHGYQLVTVFCDRDVEDTELTRPGFAGLVDAVSAGGGEEVIVLVPSRSHLSSEDLLRQNLERSIRLTGARLVALGDITGDLPGRQTC